MKETKTVSGTPEARAAMHEMMAAFEAFKGANDARLDEIERKRSVDALLEEKVARIDQAVGAAQARLDRVVSEGRLMAGSPRFRIRVLDGADEKRTFEVGTDAATYPAADRAVDFPAGQDAESRIAVAQWGEGYGWGCEASVALRA